MDVLDFWKNYELLSSTKNLTVNVVSSSLNCRFCGRTNPEVTFNNTAHIIPELLGKNNFISSDECDVCNKRFSAFESHLAIFLRPYLTMFGVYGKNGIPKFESRSVNGDQNTKTKIEVTGELQRKVELGELEDYQIDEGNNTISITFRKAPHRPKFVYKAAVKVGLSLLPAECVAEHVSAMKWILDQDTSVDTFLAGFLTVLTYKKFGEPFADLYRAKAIEKEHSFIPDLTLVLGFSNVVLQMFLPSFQTLGIKKSPELNVYPAFAHDDLTRKQFIGFTGLLLDESNSISTNQTLTFKYQEAEVGITK